MKNILFPCVCTCTVAVFGIAAMTISADAADQDFLVTSSYVQSVTQNTLTTAMEMLADETFSPVYLYASQSLDAVVDDYDADAIYAAVLDATLHAYYQPALSSDYYLCTDNTLAVNFGESFSLDYGAVTVTSGSLIDLTAGGEITAGTALVKGASIFACRTKRRAHQHLAIHRDRRNRHAHADQRHAHFLRRLCRCAQSAGAVCRRYRRLRAGAFFHTC